MQTTFYHVTIKKQTSNPDKWIKIKLCNSCVTALSNRRATFHAAFNRTITHCELCGKERTRSHVLAEIAVGV